MKSQGRREQNKELESHYNWLETKAPSTRNRRRLLLKIARERDVELEGASDHKDVIAAMKTMKVVE